jgi:hypothetical protein
MPESKLEAESLDFIFKQISYIFGCGSLMIAGYLVVIYGPKLFTYSTLLAVLSAISGLLLTLIGFCLAVRVCIHGSKEINSRYKSSFKGKVYIFFYWFMVIQIVMVSYMATTEKTQQDQQYNKSLKQDK